MSNFFYNWLDIIVIGFVLGQMQVGAYEVAWRVASILLLFSNALSNSLFPKVSSWNTSTNYKRIVSMLPHSLIASYLLVVPGFFGILVLSDEILEIIFGTEYVFASTVLIILAGIKLLDATRIVVRPTLQGIGHANLSTVAAAISGISNIVLNFVLVWQFGLIGAAFATTGAAFVSTSLQYYYLQNIHSFIFPVKEFGWTVISSSLMATILVIIQLYFHINSVFRLGVAISSGILIYFIVLLLSPTLRLRLLNRLFDLI